MGGFRRSPFFRPAGAPPHQRALGTQGLRPIGVNLRVGSALKPAKRASSFSPRRASRGAERDR